MMIETKHNTILRRMDKQDAQRWRKLSANKKRPSKASIERVKKFLDLNTNLVSGLKKDFESIVAWVL